MSRFRRLGVILLPLAGIFHCAAYDEAIAELSAETVEKIRAADKAPEKNEAELQDRLEVGVITVLNQTVLPPDDFFAPLLNNVHFVTRRDTIADELNFKSGDKIFRWELYDAERYIRMLDPVKQARIIETPNPKTGKTDLTVITRDKLSAYARGGGSGSGGYSSFGIQVGETSLFGRLYSIGATYTRENFRDFIGLSAGKLRIGGSRWEIGVSTLDGFSNSIHNYESRGGYIAHPFTIDGQRHSFYLGVFISQGVMYDYLGGGIRKGYDITQARSFDLIYRNRSEEFTTYYLHGIGKNHRIEFGPGFQQFISRDYYVFPQDQYQISDTRELPVSAEAKKFYLNEQFSSRAATFTVNTRNGNFVPMTNFRRYLFVEDQFEGFRTTTNLAHANPVFGLSDHYTKLSFVGSYQDNFRRKTMRVETAFARTATFWENRYELPRDDAWNFDLRFFRFAAWGTMALRAYAASGNNMSAYARGQIALQFTRGFYYGSLTPSAGLLASAEYRSPAWKLPYILLAGVAFFDYAGVGNRLNALEWYPIAGLGLRSMLHEFDNNIFRLDFGFNLNDSEINLLNAIQFGLSHTF